MSTPPEVPEVPEPSEQQPGDRRPIRLSAREAEALDALLEERRGSATGSLPASALLSPPRQDPGGQTASGARARVAPVLSLLDQCPAEDPPGDLLQRTLAAVQRQQQTVRNTQQTTGRRLLFAPMRWPEIGAIAAMLIIGFSLAVPVLVRSRDDARRYACLNHLADAGQALTGYASDHQDVLPRAAATPGGVWYRTGVPGESNSAHLYLLARLGYIKPDRLNCPQNPLAPAQMSIAMRDWPAPQAVSYSYQNQFTPAPLRVDRAPGMAVLADKNPLFEVDDQGALIYRSDLLPTTASNLHGQRGQNLLTANGSARWSERPVLRNGDNIWLIRGVTAYRGDEAPSEVDDSFLVP